jgi:hypothetical protein
MTALVYAGLGDVDNAIDRLERAYDAKSYYMAAIGTLPIFDGLRADSRFKSLLERVGLSPQTGESSPHA